MKTVSESELNLGSMSLIDGKVKEVSKFSRGKELHKWADRGSSLRVITVRQLKE